MPVFAVLMLLSITSIASVSAGVIYDEEINFYQFTGGEVSCVSSTGGTGGSGYGSLYITNVENKQDISYIVVELFDSSSLQPEGILDYTYTQNGITKNIRRYTEYNRNIFSQVTSVRYTFFPQDWDVGSLTGQFVLPTGQVEHIWFSSGGRVSGGYTYTEGGYTYPGVEVTRLGGNADVDYKITLVSGIDFRNHIKIETTDNNYALKIDLKRVVYNRTSPSTLKIYAGDDVIQTDYSPYDRTFNVLKDGITKITVESGDNEYIYPIAEPVDSGDSGTVTVYVRNSQTGALLADAHIEIQDTTTDPWTEVVNQTLTSGQGTISLAKDPGIHLTQYRIGVTVPGYQQVVPALFFRVVGPTNVVVEMEPVEGGPVNEDNAYLEFYVRDLNANGIPNANVLVDGQLRWTNAQGYTQIEVAKNASYPYSVSKSGYVTIEGTATVADGPRYVVNVVLGPGSVPTYTPTPDPSTGETPGATPTPDHRTNEQKGQAVIDMIADNAEGIGALALICLLMGLLKLLAKW